MYCQDCNKRETCKEICKEVKAYLKSQGIYDADYIRPEISSKTRQEERENGINRSKFREIPFTDLKWNKDGVFTEKD